MAAAPIDVAVTGPTGTFGFGLIPLLEADPRVGTVVGIAMALQQIDPDAPDLRQLTASLGVAFYTTLVALVHSAFLVLGLQLIQAREEWSVNAAGQYVLKNLVNRLYAG